MLNLFAETFCNYRRICSGFLCGKLKVLLCNCLGRSVWVWTRNPRRLMRSDRSWAAGNEFSAEMSCWNSTSVQKASRGLILYLNLVLWLLKMLTFAQGWEFDTGGNWLPATPANYNNKSLHNSLFEKCRKKKYFLRKNAISQNKLKLFPSGKKKNPKWLPESAVEGGAKTKP